MLLNNAVNEVRREISHVWKTPSSKDDILWIVTEVGELVDALMRMPGFPDVDPTRANPRTSTRKDVAEEAADVLIMLTSLCDSMGIDLWDAFLHKLSVLKEEYSTTEDSLDNSN